jgi:tetratricopeptide (TPR) repeat protein
LVKIIKTEGMDSFKALRQISEYLSKYKMKQIDILGNEESQSRFTEFYALLHSGKLEDDDVAAQHFYGVKANAKTASYRKFKSLFKERLLNTFMFIDASHNTLSDRQSAGIVLHKDWVTANLLFSRGLTYAYVALGEQMITEAIKFDFYDIALDIIVKVKGIYATQIGDKKKYEHYNNLYRECFEIVRLEYHAREHFEKIRINYVKSIRFQPEQAEAARLAYIELKPYMDKFDSFNLHFFGRSIEMMQYACLNKYTELLPVTESMIEFFKQKPFECRPPITSALQSKLTCCISLQKYEEGEQAVKDCLEMTDEGTVNWFKTLELQVILYLHTGRYKEAFDIYDAVRMHSSKKYMQEIYREIWLLIEAYLYFLISNDFVPSLSIKTANLGKFKLNKFLNEVEIFTHDKSGSNIPTLIVQIILLVSEGKEDRIYDYLERLMKYRQRYVSQHSASYRSNEFIKVLEKLPAVNFNAKRFETATKGYIDNIKAVPVNVFEDGFRLEMVPYDIVWGLMLGIMGKKKK